MDPVSAVGLASAVITFVEAASTFVGGAVEIYNSVDGTRKENRRLDHAKHELDYLCALRDKGPACRTEAEERISEVAKDCQADSKALQDILKKIADPGNKGASWRSLKASWRSLRSRKDVAELKSRLQEHRAKVLFSVVLLLR